MHVQGKRGHRHGADGKTKARRVKNQTNVFICRTDIDMLVSEKPSHCFTIRVNSPTGYVISSLRGPTCPTVGVKEGPAQKRGGWMSIDTPDRNNIGGRGREAMDDSAADQV